MLFEGKSSLSYINVIGMSYVLPLSFFLSLVFASIGEV